MLTFRDACAITDTTTDTTILTGGAFTQTMAARYNLNVSIQGLAFNVKLKPPSSETPFKGCLILEVMVIFLQRVSSIQSCLPSKAIFHQKSSSIKGHLPLKVIFHQR